MPNKKKFKRNLKIKVLDSATGPANAKRPSSVPFRFYELRQSGNYASQLFSPPRHSSVSVSLSTQNVIVLFFCFKIPINSYIVLRPIHPSKSTSECFIFILDHPQDNYFIFYFLHPFAWVSEFDRCGHVFLCHLRIETVK